MPIALIVKADEPALFFSSVRSAEIALEAIDVRDGVYPEAYGPSGEPYSIGTNGERVVITAMPIEARPQELLAVLQKFLATIGAESNGDLSDLLSTCESYIDS